MGIFDGLGKILFNRAGQGTYSTVYCKRCKKDTKQLQISYADMAEGHKKNWDKKDTQEKAEDIANRVLDHVPFVPSVLFGNAYKCTVCGNMKTSGGLKEMDETNM
jgi:ribosomal protein L44E